MAFPRSRRCALFLVLACLSAGFKTLAAADSDLRSPILLRSASGHGGTADWQMRKASEAGAGATVSAPGFSATGWRSAVVPGTVLNSLVFNKVYPEPYFGRNNDRGLNLIPDIFDKGADFYTYWFRTKFTVPPTYAGKRVWLQLDGINYTADIWVNGQQVGTLAGMFQRGTYDITSLVTPGSSQNALAILVHPIDPPNGFSSPTNTGGNAKNENANGADGKIGRYTTMLMTAGWDFTFNDGIRDRNTGIWKDVKIYATGPVALRNPFVKSSLPLPSLTPASETISVEVTNATDKPQSGTLTATIAEGNISLQQNVTLAANETRTVTFAPADHPKLVINNPRLWWPFNKGDQPLYNLTTSFTQNGAVSDELKTRFGLRDIRTDRNTPDGSRIFYVNGKRVFLHGTNWIPEGMLRTSTERTEAELRYTRQAGVNFIRFWGGGITESDEFFDLCDELGIMVWVEFWLTGNTALPSDTELYRANVTDTVKRIRNHPCVAYYVSANERSANSVVPIADLLNSLDGTRGYQPASEIDGIHDGSPYVSVNPMWYYEDTASARGSRINGLCPEYGAPILPTVDALREMMPEADLWPINTKTWKYLDGGGFHEMATSYVNSTNQYGKSSSIDEFAFKAQMFGGLAYRAIWECWNANRFEYGDRFTTGLLFWYHNSPHPQVCGRMWDWSLEPTAALYFSQKAHEPVHAQYDFLKNTVGVNNELPRAFDNMKLNVRIFNFDMTKAYDKTTTFDLPEDRFVPNVQAVTLPENLSQVHFIKLELRDSLGKLVSENFYWRSKDDYTPGRTATGPQYAGFSDLSKLPKVEINSTVTQRTEGGKNYYRVVVSNPSRSLAFMVWLRLQDGNTNKPIRPAFYDDNFFSLLPGESRSIDIEYSGKINPATTKLIVDGWNVARKQYRQGAVTVLPDIHDYKNKTEENLALGKTVTASSVYKEAVENAVDGNAGTRWSSSYANNQWIQVDLGSPQIIDSVELTWESAYGATYRIETSLNGSTWSTAKTNNEGQGGIERLAFAPRSARYVRMYGLTRATQYGFSLWEFGIYAPSNVARGAAAKASTSQTGRPASGAIDSDTTTTRWSSEYLDNQWIEIDFGESRTISGVKLLWEAAFAKSYNIQTSVNGETWSDAAAVPDGIGGEEFLTFPMVDGRYVRMLGLERATAFGFSLWDFAAYSPSSGMSAPENTPPAVKAGATGVAFAGVPFSIQGSVSDDGRPSGALDTEWSSISGLGAPAFANIYSPTTTVTFPQKGNYTLRLRATDGTSESTDDLAVSVQSLYENWAATYFTSAQLSDPAVSGPEADANGDGFSNALCYATGTSPWDQNAGGLPKIGDSANRLDIHFLRNTHALDVRYIVEASEDLTRWETIASSEFGGPLSGPATVSETGPGPIKTVIVTDIVAFGLASSRFLRLRTVVP